MARTGPQSGARAYGDRSEDEDEELDDLAYKEVKDAVLFAIDISHNMLASPIAGSKKGNQDCAALAALKCAYQLMQQRIISNPTDMMGVLLFGTEETKFMDGAEANASSYPHCYLLTDLRVPAATDVKHLRNLVQDENECARIMKPSKDGVAMSNVLFCANQIFTMKAANFSSRRLFLVTDNDSPHADDKIARNAAAVRAKDLYDLGVLIELFPISHPHHDFDRTLFYDDLVYRGLPSDPEATAPLITPAKPSSAADGIGLLQSLLSSINSKATPRRAHFSVPFEIGPGLKIGVKGYVMVKRQEVVKSCYVWTGGEEVQLATASTTSIADDTARTVGNDEIKKGYTFGGETVAFTNEEAKELRNFGQSVIRLIGFKSTHSLPLWANLRPASFVYPSETDYIGSTRVFSALQQKMAASRKYALVWFIPRRSSSPTLAAMFPAEEKLDERGQQISPPGLWISPLPFADDIRLNPDATIVPAPEILVNHFAEVVSRLQLPKKTFDPARYPNPSLQWFYRILQAMALEEDIPETPEDHTLPRYRQIKKHAGELVVKWGSMLDEAYIAWIGSSKRDSDDMQDYKQKPKRVKTEGISDEEIRQLYKQDKISSLPVVTLREWLKSKVLDTSGRKADLVANVEQYFDRN